MRRVRGVYESTNSNNVLEELADILEIIHAITEYHGFSIEDLENVRRSKAEKQGEFKEKVFLIDVED
ncbi:hypothetical protein DFO73_101570 [Cytobacillus oceanisediminis]|uniref:Phosphoribosyl-ATP pyrophosphohydrolase n=1 Tax=Cytobacillus oceanisediminis TaxID=665099 RepID=A0A2V3A6B6_9BACI|nr:hypothetical protein DFO73_101570 [Cytobacillus oceanisediminis]